MDLQRALGSPTAYKIFGPNHRDFRGKQDFLAGKKNFDNLGVHSISKNFMARRVLLNRVKPNQSIPKWCAWQMDFKQKLTFSK